MKNGSDNLNNAPVSADDRFAGQLGYRAGARRDPGGIVGDPTGDLTPRNGTSSLGSVLDSAIRACEAYAREKGIVVRTDLDGAGESAVGNDDLAAAAGIQCGDGVMVDEHGRTSDPAIFAAGGGPSPASASICSTPGSCAGG